MPLFLRALTASALLLLLTPGPGAGEELSLPPPSPTSSTQTASQSASGSIEQAQALIDGGRFEEAILVLRSLLEQEQVEANTIFLYGLASLEASQRPGRADDEREILLNEAIAAFHAMLVEAPGLVRVRLELARAFFLKGEDELATAPLRGGAGGRRAGGRGRQRQSLPRRDQGARALELQRRLQP